MASLFERMSREQLLIAAFFSTPKSRRFMAGGGDPELTPEQMVSKLMITPSMMLGELSTEGLRAYAELHGSARLSEGQAEELRSKFSGACAESIEAMAKG